MDLPLSPSSSAEPCGVRLSPATSREVAEVISSANALVANAQVPGDTEVADLSTARAILDLVWRAVWSALDCEGGPALDGARRDELVRLLSRTRWAQNEIQAEEIARSSAFMQASWEALGRFRGIDTVAQIRDVCPKIMSDIGFDRTMIASFRSGEWIPHSVHLVSESLRTRDLTRSLHETSRALLPTDPELPLLSQHDRVVLVDGAGRAGPCMFQAYAVASIICGGKVAGFIYGAFQSDEDMPDQSAADALRVFAEGLDCVLERAVVSDRIATVYGEVDKLSANIAAAMDDFDGTGSTVDRLFRSDVEVSGSLPGEILTKRECEVMRLMAAGCGNTKIAGKLFISPATVKSHVKHILRKTGSSNRTEAVSFWFNEMNLERSA